MAESAVHLVIEYLVPLLVQEAKLLKGIHNDVASIKGELEMIQSYLKDANARAEKESVSNVAQTWVKHAREKAFLIEDVIDEYILHITKHPQTRKRFRFLVDIIPGMTLERHVIACKIQDINNDLKALRERGERFGFNSLEQGGPSSDTRRAPIDYIPEEVGNLFHLKYLSLRDTKVEKLPKSIGKLKNLKTLDLKRSRVSELPVEISGLSKLRYLVAYIENSDIEYNINFRRGNWEVWNN
ncbi:disease resistance protein RPM1-like [Fagus crenata]